MTPIDPISGAPLPYGPPDTGGPTSSNVGSELDFVREAIRLLSMAIQVSEDDVHIAGLQKHVAGLSDLLAKTRQTRDKAAGIRPEDRATGELMAGLGLGGVA